MKNTRRIIQLATVALPAISAGQSSAPLSGSSAAVKPTSPNTVVGGIPFSDTIRLSISGAGAPLRFGNVIKGSEWITLNGKKLAAGTDYTIDNAMGVVYLQVAFKEGDSLSVQYRHDPKAAPVTTTTGIAPAMKFNLAGTGLSMQFGLGQMERTADGKIMRSNLIGTRNAFSGGGTSLTGAYFSGTRQREQVSNGLTFDANAKGGQLQAEAGDNSFLVQSLKMGMAGGASFFADIQDISKDFTGFSSVKEAGYKDDQIGAFTRERGLKRQGLGFSNLNVGGMLFSGVDRTVSNGDKSIDTATYSLVSKGLTYSKTSEKVERGFTRFQDLGLGDWQRLSQSQGIQKSHESISMLTGLGQFKLSRTDIDDFEKKNGVGQTSFGLDGARIGFEYKTQKVDSGFNRFEADRGLLGQEAGLERQSFSLTKLLLSPGSTLMFNQSDISTGNASFDSRDIKFKAKNWNFDSSTRAVDKSFNRLGSLRPEEMDANTRAIANMYGAGVIATPNDRPSFMQSFGLDRTGTAMGANLGKGASLTANNINIGGQTDDANISSLKIVGNNGQFSVRRMNVGDNFNELNRLMPFEQRQFGIVGGLARTDTILELNLGKGATLNANMLSADRNGETLERSKLAYRSSGIELDHNERKVSQGFGVANQMEDSEKDLLGYFNGFNQQDTRLKYTGSKHVQLDYLKSSAYNATSQESRDNLLFALNLSIDSATQFGYLKQDSSNQMSLDTLLASSLERVSVSRQLSPGTAFAVTNEQKKYDGSNNHSPDSNRTTVSLETKLNPNTSLRTEQSKTSFSDGNTEEVNSNTVSTQIAKNVGVSVTNTNINRDGEDRDEVKRDYGFWWDFGKGVRMTYGYVRQLNGQNAGFAASGFAFGQNAGRINPDQAMAGSQSANINGTQFGFANGTNTWDDQAGRTQAFSNFSLQTTKPFRLGFFENTKISAASSMASDNSRWLREDIASSFESNIGKYGFGYQFKGQVNQQGQRALDRTYRFKTDYSNKSPLSASFIYKQRVLPNGTEFAIRDYKVDWRLSKGFQVSNQIQTNPEGPYNPNLLLGTQPLAQRRNIWRLDYTGNKDLLIGGQYDEMRDDNIESIRRTAGLNMTLFQSSGSPLNLFYGIEQNTNVGGTNSYVRYGLSFDQRPGPNQVLSLSVGNQGWLQNVNSKLVGQNDWIGRLNYQWRFK